eukprot:TRINITY_DN9172_c0_g1_i5.p1 TRINITY_DN9172_c0_g1~~TRINITY_DN9172_c0_g1_i5.p1  ORF type:complete len:528 (-),score=91.37 TRINITY_DN9172_c0_g1_i5:4-1587(-)
MSVRSAGTAAAQLPMLAREVLAVTAVAAYVAAAAALPGWSALQRPTLDYCPPVDLLGDPRNVLLCGLESNFEGNGYLQYLERRAEEIEIAASGLREAGLLSRVSFECVIRLAEACFLILCVQRFRCIFENEADFHLEMVQRAHDMESYALDLRKSGQLDMSWEVDATADVSVMLESLHEELYKLHMRGNVDSLTDALALAPGFAWYPEDVVSGCSSLDVRFPGPSLPASSKEWRLVYQPLLRVEWVLDLIASRVPLARRALNLGAHDGRCRDDSGVVNDHANCAFDRGFGGVAIEGDPALRDALHERRWSGVSIHVGYITPANVSAVLGAEAALEFDLLKIDLDHADCVFADALLRGLARQPKVLHVEYNPVFPPPVRYRERFSMEVIDGYAAVEDSWTVFRHYEHWMGCSLQAWIDTLEVHGYQLFQVEWNDLTFVRGDLFRHVAAHAAARDPLTLWKAGTWCRAPGRLKRGLQRAASIDFRVLSESAELRCEAATAWFRQEGADARGDLSCGGTSGDAGERETQS